MKLIYNFAIRTYGFAIYLASVLNNKKANLLIKGRKNWRKNLNNQIKLIDNWTWFHCSSFGEFEDIKLFIQLYIKRHPEQKILLTFHSPSGYEHFKNNKLADYTTYIPLDTKSNAFDFIRILKPTQVFFSRSELWYNFISILKSQHVPLYLLGLSLTEKSSFIKFPQKLLYKKCFIGFSQIFCQNSLTENILKSKFYIHNTTVTGNPRLDNIIKEKNTKKYPKIEHFINGQFCIIVGSSLAKDEKIVHKAINSLKNLNIKWIIVPHEISSKLTISSKEFVLYSNFEKNQINKKIMYVDFVGGLKHIYQYADIALVGGGFDKIGIHNILEPAIYNVPVLIGPNHRNYPEAIAMLKTKHCYVFKNANELIELLISKEIIINKLPNTYLIKNKLVNQRMLDHINQKN